MHARPDTGRFYFHAKLRENLLLLSQVVYCRSAIIGNGFGIEIDPD
ncbi:MAG: hypothetical protein GQF41_3433 [Candidatus Rifleibacterium amylolyticum]|nr:MAG: hypothetical protein GQF41_3433 [Candidatus Rifleibacterium amylolyticum]